MMTNKVIRPVEDKYCDDAVWNGIISNLKSLEDGKSDPTWFNTPWLIIECYLYRRIFEALRMR